MSAGRFFSNSPNDLVYKIFVNITYVDDAFNFQMYSGNCQRKLTKFDPNIDADKLDLCGASQFIFCKDWRNELLTQKLDNAVYIALHNLQGKPIEKSIIYLENIPKSYMFLNMNINNSDEAVEKLNKIILPMLEPKKVNSCFRRK